MHTLDDKILYSALCCWLTETLLGNVNCYDVCAMLTLANNDPCHSVHATQFNGCESLTEEISSRQYYRTGTL